MSSPIFSEKYKKIKIFCLLQLIVISTKGTDRDVIVILVSALVCESCFVNPFIIPLHTSHRIVAGYYGFTLDVRVSVCPSVHPSVIRPSIHFSFSDDTLSKHQWIFTKLGMCIDIVEIWFGIANGPISSNFYRVNGLRHDKWRGIIV